MIKPPHFVTPSLESCPEFHRQALLLMPFEKKRFDFIWHQHPAFELTHIRCGFGVRYVGKSIQPFQEGDLCLLGGNLPHAYGTHPRHFGTCQWSVVHFLPESWGPEFWRLQENRHVAAMLATSRHGLKFSGQLVPEVADILYQISTMPLGSGRRIIGFLNILHALAETSNRHLLNAETETVGSTIDPRISTVLEWLEQNASGPINQSDSAKLVHMSPAAFSRFFSKKTGRNFSRYLNEIRIARACSDLLTTDKSIVEIAFGAGFNNLANFNRRFREATHMTPRDYRRLLNNP